MEMQKIIIKNNFYYFSPNYAAGVFTFPGLSLEQWGTRMCALGVAQNRLVDFSALPWRFKLEVD